MTDTLPSGVTWKDVTGAVISTTPPPFTATLTATYTDGGPSSWIINGEVTWCGAPAPVQYITYTITKSSGGSTSGTLIEALPPDQLSSPVSLVNVPVMKPPFLPAGATPTSMLVTVKAINPTDHTLAGTATSNIVTF